MSYSRSANRSGCLRTPPEVLGSELHTVTLPNVHRALCRGQGSQAVLADLLMDSAPDSLPPPFPHLPNITSVWCTTPLHQTETSRGTPFVQGHTANPAERHCPLSHPWLLARIREKPHSSSAQSHGTG